MIPEMVFANTIVVIDGSGVFLIERSAVLSMFGSYEQCCGMLGELPITSRSQE